MKIKSLVVIVGLVAFAGMSHAAEGQKKGKREISPEMLEKYDTDKDGKLNKEERAEMRKNKPAKGEKNGGKKNKNGEKKEAE